MRLGAGCAPHGCRGRWRHGCARGKDRALSGNAVPHVVPKWQSTPGYARRSLGRFWLAPVDATDGQESRSSWRLAFCSRLTNDNQRAKSTLGLTARYVGSIEFERWLAAYPRRLKVDPSPERRGALSVVGIRRSASTPSTWSRNNGRSEGVPDNRCVVTCHLNLELYALRLPVGMRVAWGGAAAMSVREL